MNRWIKGYAALGLLLATAGCSRLEPCRPLSLVMVRLGNSVYSAPSTFSPLVSDTSIERSVVVQGGERLEQYCSRKANGVPRTTGLSFSETDRLPGQFAPLRQASFVMLRPAGARPATSLGAQSGRPWRGGLTYTGSPEHFSLQGARLGKWNRPISADCIGVHSSSQDRHANCRIYLMASSGDVIVIDVKLERAGVEQWPELYSSADRFFSSIRQK